MSQLPFKAYQGDDPFIFISYAHKDSERVFPIIQHMHKQGYRIWYDEGIEPGSEWPEEIATHLTEASAVLLFVSPNSMDSHNVRREVTFGINLRKLMVSVYLEPTEMSAGMSLQLGLNQAVHYYAYHTDADFFEKLLPALPEKAQDDARMEVSAPEPHAIPQQPVAQQSAPQQEQPAPFQMPDKLETAVPQPVAATEVALNADFDPQGMVLPFMPKGAVTLRMKNGGEATCPLNCFVVPKPEGNFDCLCMNKALKGNEQYLFGARGDTYRFGEMTSIDISEGSGGVNLIIYLTNGERRFFENVDPFEVGGLFGRSFRRYQIADISQIVFDPNGVTESVLELALVTTKSGISFYTPVGMLETVQFSVGLGGGGYARYSGFQLEEGLLEYRKMISFEIDVKEGGPYSDSEFSVSYTMRSGIAEAMEFKRHYTPSLSGMNQFGCFNLTFLDIARIDVYAGGREDAPPPTPLPDIMWPEPQARVVSFFGEGRAEITNAAGTTYECPANAVLGVDSYGRTATAYEAINTNITGEGPFFELFRVSDLTKFEDLESIELSHDGGWGDEYPVRMRDTSGVTLEGEFSHSAKNAAPGLVFTHGGEKGAVRFMALKSVKFDHDADAPDVEDAAVYTKNGRAIGIPRGTVVFSGCGLNSYPGCCFVLPIGNSVDIDSLKRMMIHDQESEAGLERWLVFECEGLRGAFPLPPELWKDYKLYGASEFGLCALNAGEDWYLLDMKR